MFDPRYTLAIVASLLLSASAWAAVAVDGDRITLDTALGRVTVERGTIVAMENKLTGERYAAADGPADLAGLAWPKDEKLLDAEARVKTRRIGANAARVEAVLAGGHAMTTTFTIDQATQDIRIQQSGSASTKGLCGVEWGVAGIPDAAVECLVPGYSGMRLGADYPREDMAFSWPTSWEVQMVAAHGRRGGFWVWTQDERLRFKRLRWRRREGRVSLTFRSLNYGPFDELTAVESVEWRLAFYRGDWRVPAKRYRDWAERTWGMTPLAKQQPHWVNDVRFVVIMGMDTALLDELKRRVPPEATLLYIPGWRRDGYDVNYPDYTGHERFGEFVRYARDLGYHVMPHMNYFGCDPKHPAYERFQQWHMRFAVSKSLAWWIPPRQRRWTDREPTIQFAYINPAAREWRDDLTRRLVAAQKRYGFDAIHLDQTLCIFNTDSGPVDGLSCAEGNVELHKQLREAMPNVALSGEGLDEITCRYEAFAQRHAGHAVNHVHGSWDDDFIACGHPISSYFLTPYTKIYGYLGLCNPRTRGLFLAWRRAYENWGVVPTLSRPSIGQVRAPQGEAVSLFAEAEAWTSDQLEPDLDAPWPDQTKLQLRGRGGVVARYERTQGNGTLFVRIANGERHTVYATVRGKSEMRGPGTIPNWFAYDRERLIGLDPAETYTYLSTPRDLRQPHIQSVSEHVRLAVRAADEHKFSVALIPIPSTPAIDLAKGVGEAETGIVVGGQTAELRDGGSFRSSTCDCDFVLKKGIFAHPPWKVRQDQGDEPAQAFGRYRLSLPRDEIGVLEFCMGLRSGVNGRSDGVQFIVDIDGERVFDEVWAESVWKPASVPLDRWAGRDITLTLITTPGPERNPSFDWACWGEPRIRFTPGKRRGEMVFVTPRPALAVVSSDPAMTSQSLGETGGMHAYRVGLDLPGRVAVLYSDPQPVVLPVDLANTPFTLSVMVEDAPAQLSIQYVGAGPGKGSSAGETRQGISAHPPQRGHTSLDYLLRLPDREPITLEFAAGVRDRSQTSGVIFIVEANARELYRQRLSKPDGWHPAQVDLSAFAGQTVLLSLIVDADGSYAYDWATWADPMLK